MPIKNYNAALKQSASPVPIKYTKNPALLTEATYFSESVFTWTDEFNLQAEKPFQRDQSDTIHLYGKESAECKATNSIPARLMARFACPQ